MAGPTLPITTGVAETELVVRGGYLKAPEVFTQLKLVDGSKFMYLVKSSHQLSKFLSREATHKRPLAKTDVFERLQKLRDDRYRAFLVGEGDGPGAPTEADPCEQLCLDSIVATSPAKLPPRRLLSSLRQQVPSQAEVVMPRQGQEPWRVTVLLERATKAVAIEATSANLHALFELVDNDLTCNVTRRKRYGADATSRPIPHGPKECRKYAVGRKWVTKIREGGPDGAKPRVRTLVRLRSDEHRAAAPAKLPRRRKAMACGSAEMVQPPAMLGAVLAGDCLDV
jgi:hypothetical protein